MNNATLPTPVDVPVSATATTSPFDVVIATVTPTVSPVDSVTTTTTTPVDAVTTTTASVSPLETVNVTPTVPTTATTDLSGALASHVAKAQTDLSGASLTCSFLVRLVPRFAAAVYSFENSLEEKKSAVLAACHVLVCRCVPDQDALHQQIDAVVPSVVDAVLDVVKGDVVFPKKKNAWFPLCCSPAVKNTK